MLIAVAFGLAGYAAGLSADTSPARPPSHLKLLSRDLELRPEQKAAIGSLLARQDRDLQALVEQARAELADPTASRLQQTEDDMLALLDAQQRERYLSLAAAPGADAR
ncbi:MAG: hypothetical protein DRQ55_17650 [Planctomycetota bacterium]|nr:MAG: hypothetical protein DRQ55_17650 [Planctomycetota bacterium]